MSDADATNFDSHEPHGAEQVDYDGDGHADGYLVHESDGSAYEVVDTNHDGSYDTVLVDTDGDGDADAAGYDTDGDHRVDTNHDGTIDTAVADTNDDGKADYAVVDTDGDGDADVAYTDSNEDGHWEQAGQAPSGGTTPDYASA